VKPQEDGRPPYEVRIWVKEDGLAFDCTCPMGTSDRVCKHTVAVTIAHLEQERLKVDQQLDALREKLMDLSLNQLFEGLLERARVDRSVLTALEELVD
jgi:uncharacterized Zn finger protein